jgi:hypothetical protein
MVKIVIAAVLLAHGIGHSMGLLQLAKIATVNPTWHGQSWLLTGLVGTTSTQMVGGLIWTASMIGFVGLAAAVMGWLPASWLIPLAIGSAVVSMVGLLLFPAALPVSSTLGALVVDVVVVLTAVWYQLLATDSAA